MRVKRELTMKTQTRITLLLAVITLLFIAGFVMLGQHEARQEVLLISSKIYEKNTLFDRVLRLEQASLEMFAYDFSTREEIVAAVTGSGQGPAILLFGVHAQFQRKRPVALRCLFPACIHLEFARAGSF